MTTESMPFPEVSSSESEQEKKEKIDPVDLGVQMIKERRGEIGNLMRLTFDPGYIEDHVEKVDKWVGEHWNRILRETAEQLAQKFPDIEIKPSLWKKITGEKASKNENPAVEEYVRRLEKNDDIRRLRKELLGY
jgi:hypothetical protein